MLRTNFITRPLVLLVTIFLFVFTSCKKDPEPAPSFTGKIAEYKTADESIRFEYNANGDVQKVFLNYDVITSSDNVTYTVKYHADKKIDELVSSNGVVVKVSYSNGKLSKTEVFEGADKIAITEFTYNGTVLQSGSISYVYGIEVFPFVKFDYAFTPAGNVSRTDVSMYNPLTTDLEYAGQIIKQYDTKINPFKGISDLMLTLWQLPTTNNVIKEEHFDENGMPNETIETTYVYNEQGYPVKATIRETQPGQQTVVATATYSYK
ncbi:MAG: hypothetical protein KGZ74_19635 [Chitinophagaceae bacterium]|nr:hypothetical protein [Chitinophagaceae bacterium]